MAARRGTVLSVPNTTPNSADSSSVEGDGSRTPPLYGVFVLAGLVIVGAGLQSISNLAGPVFLVVTLVITVQPLRGWLVRRHVPGWLGSLVAMLGVYALLAMVIGSVVWSLTQLATVLPSYSGAFSNLYNRTLALLAEIGIGQGRITEAISSINLTSFTGIAQTVVNTVTSGLSLLALMAAVVIFLAFDAASIGERMALLRKARPGVAAALDDFASSVRKYWIVSTVFGVICAVLDVVGLLILGVPLALAWGLLAFVTNYIPNIGFILGLVPPTLIALLAGGFTKAIIVVIIYIGINVVVQTIIQPRFTGDAVGITPTLAFISLVFWAGLLGPLGALLAVPATLMVKVLLVDHTPRGRWLGALINATAEPRDAPFEGPATPDESDKVELQAEGEGRAPAPAESSGASVPAGARPRAQASGRTSTPSSR